MQLNTKTIDINCLEWFDKINGNSYFAGRVIVNYGMPDEKSFILPFQYGYDNQYIHESGRELNKQGYLPGFSEYGVLWRYCKENNIILRYNKVDKCKKSELMAFNKLQEQQAKTEKYNKIHNL